MKSLTKQQKKVLMTLISGLIRNGYQPSYREMAETLGYSHPSSVVVHMRALAKKGWIARDGIKSRAVQVNWEMLGLSKQGRQRNARYWNSVVKGL